MKKLFLVLGVVCLCGVLRVSGQVPAILSEPQSVTVNNASAAAFSVGATNAVTYQWYFQGTNALAGETSATLSLDDVATNQAGSYTVVVTSSNNISATSSPPAVLTIVPGTIIQWTISTYPGGSSSNFLVQLFDHDKPATVENFIHYITSGAYSNTFFDRDVTNFVLQGGDYTAVDRLPGNLDVNPISPGSGFPSQVDNEFGMGPLIHNRFGTIAMGLQSGKTNSATSAFYFNLADNSAALDVQDFTVFGRILTGTNVLQYFNLLSAPGDGIDTNFSQVPTLPLNYDSTNGYTGTNDSPSDANFFYCDFRIIGTPPVYTNLPVVSIAYPAPDAAFTNGGDLTITGTAQGTALAQVFCILNTVVGVGSGQTATNSAIGTDNWSLDLGPSQPGIYQLTAYAQDGAGNLSLPATEYFTNEVTLTVITNAVGVLSTNVEYLVPGQQYVLASAPGPGEVFLNWQVQGVASLNPLQTITAETNLTLEVTYASTNLPAGLAITNPVAGASLRITNVLIVSGTIPSSVTVTQLTVQLFTQSNSVTPMLHPTISGTNWTRAISNLAAGLYTVTAVAQDTLGQEGLVTESFTILSGPPTILFPPQNVTANIGSSASFSVTASNALGYQWQQAGVGSIAGATNATFTLNDLSTNQSGSSFDVILTTRDGESVTSAPPAVLTIVPGTIIQLTVSKFADGGSNSFEVQLFDHDKPATVANFIHYVASGVYSNMFFDTDSNYVLQGGNDVSLDRASNHLTIRSLPVGTNVFPSRVATEFNLGAVVPNAFGTLAATGSGRPGAGASGFFFNLTDNTTGLDAAGYTVFGRILSGTNVLQYFNGLSAPTNGLYDYSISQLYSLPVDYSGIGKPADANLFYCDFAFVSPTNPPVEISTPIVSIIYPAPDAALTNGAVLLVKGTAQDALPLGEVFCTLTSPSDFFGNATKTNIAQGTTNWSLNLGVVPPGTYQLTAYAQDAGGNLSAPVVVYFTNQVVLTIVTNVDGQLSTNAPQYLTPGQPYSVAAAPGAGEMFVDWQVRGVISLDPLQTFTSASNLTVEVTYASTNSPSGLAITSPAAGAVAHTVNAALPMSGTLPSSVTVTQLTVQLFAQSNAVTAALPSVINGNNWSLQVSNLIGGPYFAVAVASGPSNQVGVVTESFTVLTTPPTILSQPRSVTVNTGSAADFSVTAGDAVSYQWQQVGIGLIAGATTSTLALDDVSSNQSGSSYEVVMASPDGESVTSSPPAVLTVVPGTVIQWTISTYADGSSSNFLVELFDHDKPATVRNFIHYITSGAYSNTFIDRDVTNFVIQGGDYTTADRSDTNFDVNGIVPGTNFPSQVDNEFGVGPLIHNEFGTIAMGLQSGKTNSATSAFYFNLADNSATLDPQDFTVFGRIVTGANVLQYFNTLSAPNDGIDANFSEVPTLPLNYDSTNGYNGTNQSPTDASFFYCDFQFVGASPVYTNIPSVSIASPAPNAMLTNGGDITVTGTAQGTGLAQVFCVLTTLTGQDSGESRTNSAIGTSNWSLDFGNYKPAVYQLTAYAQDASGNLSAPATQYLTNMVVLTTITNAAGTLSTNVQYLPPGQQFIATPAPGPGEVFVDWQIHGVTSLEPVQVFTVETNLTIEVTFAFTNLPSGLAITYPAAGATVQLTNAGLNMSGLLPSSVIVTNVTVQLFAQSNAVTAALPAVIGSTSWTLLIGNLAGGPYTAVVIATDSAGQQGLVTENFTALTAPPAILSAPQNLTVNAGSSADFTVTASNALSYQWVEAGSGPIAGATSATLALNNLSTNQSGSSYQVVVTSSDGETVTSSPPAVLTVVSGTVIQLTVSSYADGGSNSFLVELFDHDKPATVENFIHYVASGVYSNMIFETDEPNSILVGGDFVTLDRTSNHLAIRSLLKGTNVFPVQVDNEYNLGPVIPNTFGTLAALGSAKPGAGSSGFFFNATDNSTNFGSFEYTVFGRIISSSNILQYFNTLAPGNGLYNDLNNGLGSLPVNYAGSNQPTDANLFYCDIKFISPTNPTVEFSTPVVSITSPPPNAALTNGSPVVIKGTAQDASPLADVLCVLTEVVGNESGVTTTNAAQGTTNWSLNPGPIPAGVYKVTAFAQDAAGNPSAPITEYFTNQAVLTIITNVDGHLINSTPQYFTFGQQYSMAAMPPDGEMFVDWQINGAASLDPLQTVILESNLTIEVTYASNNPPSGLAITNPAAGSVVQAVDANLTVSGTLPSSAVVTELTVQLFSMSNQVTTALPAVLVASNSNWSLALTNLAGGPYTVVGVATGASGQVGVVTESFSVMTAPPIILSRPQNVTANAGSSADFTVTATNAAGYQWQLVGTGPIAGATNATLALNDVSSNQSGTSYEVVVTSADGETRTSSSAELTVVQGTIIQWTVSTYPGGGSSNFLVELFDHDKPATVENFIHYVASGAYSNMFFDTDITNFILQGGGFVTPDRGANPLNTQSVRVGTNFPSQIVNEFTNGPVVPNASATLAALGHGNATGFFFNLGDNSANLDVQDYVVFGRVLSGADVLSYFNTLAPGNGLYNDTNLGLASLPVNYSGTNKPANANVFYSDFQFVSPSNAPVDTNIPSVSMTAPAPDAAFTNGSDLTATGTASGFGLADVYCVLSSLAGQNVGESETNAAQGTTNWSLDFGILNPGIYKLTAYAQDGGGNLSAPVTQYLTNLAQLIIVTNVDGQLTTNGPRYLVPGVQETVTAAPGPGRQFYNWSYNGVDSLNPVQNFTVESNVTLIVTYLSSNASASLTIASPVAGQKALAIESVLNASGSISSTNVIRLTCQFFVNSNAVTAPLPATIVGTNWTLLASNLANGSYMMVASAYNAEGPIASASVDFTLLNVELLTLKTNGLGTIVNTNATSPYLTNGAYTVKAVPAKGYAFYSWSDGVTTTLNPTKTFILTSNLTLTATFVPQDTALTGISFTYPKANAMLTNGTFNIAGTLPRSLVFTQMTCQLFLQSNSVAPAQPVTINSTGTGWTLPVTNLAGGSYSILALAYDAQGNARLISENFTLLSKLTVNVQGQGSVTAGLNGKYLQVGKAYSITGTPKPKSGQMFAYWSGGAASPFTATTPFVMTTNMVLTAYFTNNLFPAVAGTYTGLFLDPSAVSPTNAGFIKVTVTQTGTFSGDLMFPSITFPISYAFPYTGSVVLPTAANSFDTNRLQLFFSLDLTNGSDTITGFLADQTSSGAYIWVSDLLLNRNATNLLFSNAPAAGNYVFLEQPADAAPGSVATGYGAEILKTTGALTFAGALPDGAAMSESANLSKDGTWPVYIVPSSYAKKGMVIGWQTNTPSGADGQLFWRKPGTNVTTTNLTSDGAALTAPAANSQYQMVLAGGATYVLPVNQSGKFVAQSPIASMTLQPTGLLSGSIETNKTRFSFQGAFISPSEGGAGFVIESGGLKEGFKIVLVP